MINICLTEDLKETLARNNILPGDYMPAYGGESVGLDLFNCGKSVNIASGSYKPESSNFKTNSDVLIPTGLKIKVPQGYVALIQERGSIIKTPLKVRAGVIDPGYMGEVFVNCVNTGNSSYTIHVNQKLPFQIVVVKCDNHFNVVSEEEYLSLSNTSLRKEGQVGSSD